MAFANNFDFRIELLLQQVAQEDCATACAKEWAQRVRLSPSRFEHLFKNSTGISPSKYITQLRLQRARCLWKPRTYPSKK
jgi:transcriptional regulator GlxA family with amidase domain